MRLRALVAIAAAFATMLSGSPAAMATTPSPHDCKTTLSGTATPAEPGGLVATASVIVATGQVVCFRNPLTTPPIEHATAFWGHITMDVATDAASPANVCGHGPDVFDSVSSALVMTIHLVCVLPVSHPDRTRPIIARLHWATGPPYNCCGIRHLPISPAGVGP